MKKRIVININKDYCIGCTDTTCSGTLYEFLNCCIEDKEYIKSKIPETLEDIKDLLDELKIEHESIYVNDKNFKWTKKDKIKILRAINIKFKMNYCYPLTDIGITIDDCNEIAIRKCRYDGQEYMKMQFSTKEQVWNIFINIYKDAIKRCNK